MRKLWLGIIGLAAASTANAAVVTYTLSLFDNGTTLTPGVNNFAIYADVSPDSGGLYAYGVDMAPGTTYGTTFLNRGNGIVVEDTDDTGERLTLGFTQGVNTDRTLGKFSGLQDLGIGGTPVPVYGMGQHDDQFSNHYDTAKYESIVGTFGGGAAAYKAHFLLARGNWTGATPPDWERTSVDNKASVWVTNSGVASAPAQLIMIRTGEPTLNKFTLDAAADAGTTNQAVGGNIAVTGSNGKYVSEVDQLLANSATGNAPIATIGAEPGNIYVMAKLTGAAADIATFLNDPAVTADVDASDPQFALLHANYDSQFGGGGFNALFRFTNAGNNRTINWAITPAGVTVDQLAAVPEPTTMSLLGIAGLGLLARRRRNA